MNRQEQNFIDHRNGQRRLNKRELVVNVTNYLQQFAAHLKACDLRDKIKKIDPLREVTNIPLPEKLTAERFQQIQQASFIFAECQNEENIQYFYFMLKGAWIVTNGTTDGTNFENLKNEFAELCPDACKQVESTLKNQAICN